MTRSRTTSGSSIQRSSGLSCEQGIHRFSAPRTKGGGRGHVRSVEADPRSRPDWESAAWWLERRRKADSGRKWRPGSVRAGSGDNPRAVRSIVAVGNPPCVAVAPAAGKIGVLRIVRIVGRAASPILDWCADGS